MPARNPKVDVRFLVDAGPASYDSTFFNVRLRAVYVNDEGKVRNALMGGWGNPNQNRLADLTITAQADRTTDLYAFGVHYENVYRVDAGEATLMAKTLNMIQRKLDNDNLALGYCENIGQYAGRVARALGATTAVCFGESDGRSTSYDDSGFAWYSAHTLTVKLNDRLAAWKGQ